MADERDDRVPRSEERAHEENRDQLPHVPAPQAKGHNAVPWLVAALALVAAGAVVAIVLVLQGTVPNSHLEASEAELAATQAELAATEAEMENALEQAEDDREAAEANRAELEGVISVLEDDAAALEADLVTRGEELAASRGEAALLEENLVAEGERAEAAEEQVRLAAAGIEAAFDMWTWYIAWNLWTGNEFIRDLERDKADLTRHNEIVNELGLGDTWKEWARKEGAGPLRELDGFMDRVEDDELQDLFDAWFDCDARRKCVRATVVLDGALLNALTAELQLTGEALGIQLLAVSAL